MRVVFPDLSPVPPQRCSTDGPCALSIPTDEPDHVVASRRYRVSASGPWYFKNKSFQVGDWCCNRTDPPSPPRNAAANKISTLCVCVCVF